MASLEVFFSPTKMGSVNMPAALSPHPLPTKCKTPVSEVSPAYSDTKDLTSGQ